jgi:protein SCO1/2
VRRVAGRAGFRFALRALVFAVLVVTARPLAAEPGLPPELGEVDVVEHLGAKVPRDLSFVDSRGRSVRLGDYLDRGRPVVLTLVYFECPMLCGTVLSGLVKSLSSAGLVAGRDADLLTVSFDPADEPQGAERRRRHYLQALGAPDTGPLWPFLTGAQTDIAALAEAVGFRYARVRRSSEFAHAAVVFVLTPDGTLSRYLYGFETPPRDLALALVEASAGKTGRTIDRFLLHCYRYDPASRRYGLYVAGFLRTGGLIVFAALAAGLAVLWRRELHKEKAA